ncbi:MAG: hydrogenase iron-sulfur subunit [Candidatus Coatesbacteria bacterium]|nr:hydrogenase iron-sulfur subunit [Candidatus Coatesbacteria bacterium]
MPSIIVYACKWNPSIAADNAGVEKRSIPDDMRIITVECTGSLTTAMLIQPFEEGARGVLVLGCSAGECHFVNGNEFAKTRVEEAKSILKWLGHRSESLEINLMSDTSGAAFEDIVNRFASRINRLQITEMIEQTNAEYCLECGVCTGICPMSRINKSFSPRIIVEDCLLSLESEILSSDIIWTCLTCKTCEEVCPSKVNFTDFIRQLRDKAADSGAHMALTHAGILQQTRLLEAKEPRKKTFEWLNCEKKSLDTDIAYFAGCAPVYDIVFKYLDLKITDSTNAILNLLRLAGINPALSPDEVCCGHDAYWNGELDVFKRLARHNLEWIKKGNYKTVIFGCPEGYHTFKNIYPRELGESSLEVLFWTDIIMENKYALIPDIDNHETVSVTYQDPCRLGRYSGIYESPRDLLTLFENVKLKEMQKNRETSICCGSSGWVQCTSCNKSIQMSRLDDAKETEAEIMLTACPKCLIHLRCAQKDTNEQSVKLMDLASFVYSLCKISKKNEVLYAR